MPIYRLTVEKYLSLQGEYWTNVYHVSADAGLDSVPITDALVAAERPILWTNVVITKVGITLPGSTSGALYGANVYNQMGTAPFSGDLLPLFVVARVDFTVAGSRPSRKYLRGFINEDRAVSFNILPAAIADLQTYADAIAAIPGICDVDGQAITAGAPKTSIAMRQLRRGSKKRSTP